MATLGDRFPKKTLAADPDFLQNGKPIARKLTIKSVGMREFEEGMKTEVWFKEVEKSLICNRTNWVSIATVTGQDDDDKWPGHQVTFFAKKVQDASGKMVWGIRVQEDAALPVVEGFGESDPDSVPF